MDQCPQAKLQRVCEIVLGQGASVNAAGGGTFGAVGAANLILQNSNNLAASTSTNTNHQSNTNTKTTPLSAQGAAF